jgi:DNA (cytosine-5)-methyltransferase 1
VTRASLLDLGCKAGGATRGYQLAGFHVTGVDIEPQPNYVGDEFVEADMLTVPLAGYDAIHASPPCQHHANVTKWRGNAEDHVDLLTPMRARLAAQPTPYVIENVPEALPVWDLLLCGSMFGLNIKRHRGFLAPGLHFPLLAPCQHHRRLQPFMHKGERAYADAMGCGWMTSQEGRQAIPPAFTQFIGEVLLAHLKLSV